MAVTHRTAGVNLEVGRGRERAERVLLLVAMPFEARGLARRLGHEGGRDRLAIRAIGVGARHLGRLGPALLALAPSGILVAGLAGGCAPDLRPGEIVLGDPVGPTAAGTWLRPAPDLLGRARAALEAARLPHRRGRLLTVSCVVASPAAKADCWRAHEAVGVDMESAHVLAWAAEAGIPAAVVRAVADGPGDTVPGAIARAVTPGGGLRLGAASRALARPTDLVLTWWLWRRSRRALDHLARFVLAFLDSPPRAT